MQKSSTFAVVAVIIAAWQFTSCAADSSRTDGTGAVTRPLSETLQPEAGFEAVGEVWGAKFWNPDGEKIYHCGAVLIAPDKILTLSTCAGDSGEDEFRIGPNSSTPAQTIRIGWVLKAGDPVGISPFGMRKNLEVGLLERSVVGVTPMKLGNASIAHVGAELDLVRYHPANDQRVRMRGTRKVRAASGDRVASLYFSDATALRAAFKAHPPYSTYTDAELDEEVVDAWSIRVGRDAAIMSAASIDGRQAANSGAVVAADGQDWVLVGLVGGEQWVGQLTERVLPDTGLWVTLLTDEMLRFIQATDQACKGSKNWSDGKGCTYTFWSTMSGTGAVSVTNASRGYVGTLSGACENGQWTQVTDTCRVGASCGGGVWTSIGGCRYTYPASGHDVRLKLQNEAPGHTGELSGRCDDGWWTGVTDTCQ